MSIIGGDDPLTVLARGALLDLGPAIVRIRLDEGAELPDDRRAVVVVVHRVKVEMVLGTLAGGESDPRVVQVARVARAD